MSAEPAPQVLRPPDIADPLRECTEFLAALYPAAASLPAGAQFVLCTKTDKQLRSHWYSPNSLSDAAKEALRSAQGCDVYFGVGLLARQLPIGRRGRNEDVVCLPAIHLDLDIASPDHKAQDLPRTPDEALSLVSELPPPSIVVESGHGLHLYWLLERPWTFETSNEREHAQGFLRAFQEYVRDGARERGLHVDSTFDLARVLRLPGTMNYKGSPVPVRVRSIDATRRYSPQTLELAIRANRRAGARTVDTAFDDRAPSLQLLAADTQRVSSELRELIKCGRIGSRYPSRSEAVAAVEHGLIETGHSDEQIAAVLLDPANGISELPREKGSCWTASDIQRAREKHRADADTAATSVRATRFLARRDLDEIRPPEWLIEGFIPVAALAVLYGSPGCGKSFVALSWAASVATGEPWLNQVVKGGTVVYVAAEGVSGIPRRLRAWEQRFLENDALVEDIYIPREALDLRDAASVNAFILGLTRGGIAPSLVVIDTLARCVVGGDENSAKDMGQAISAIDRIRTETGAAVLLVHHTAKNGNTERGSSALRGAADAMFSLTDDGSVLSVEKQKDAEQHSDMNLSRCVIELADGSTSCIIERAGSRPVAGLGANHKQALATLLTYPANVGAKFSEWRDKSGIAEATFKRIRKELVDGKYVEQVGQRYFVADAIKISLGRIDALTVPAQRSDASGNSGSRNETGGCGNELLSSGLTLGSNKDHEPRPPEGS